MGRRTVSCREKHTPLNPGKDRVRRNWIRNLRSDAMVVTISHGALGVLDILGHKGPIQVVDIDEGVIESTEYMRQPNRNSGRCDYPELNLLVPQHATIQNWIRHNTLSEARRNALQGGAVDVDLADVMTTCFPTLEEVLTLLVTNKVHTKVLFTFRNGRDNFNSTASRLQWLKDHLPRGTKIVGHEEYYSGRITENAARKHGSTMCIVELRT